MQANLRRVLVTVAFIVSAPSAFADVITDWNEKAVAFVTPRMAAARRPESRGDGSGRNVRRGQLDRAPLPTLSGSASGDPGGLERGGGSSGGRHASWRVSIHRRKESSRPPWPPISLQFRTAMQSRRDPARRGGGGESSGGARQRWLRRPGFLSAQDQARRLCPDPDHRRLGVAEREAVRHDEPIAVPTGASDPAQERAVGRRL